MIDQGCMSKIDNNGGIKVNSINWETFVNSYNIDKIDLLLLDCEGYEFNILNQIDFSKIKPDVIRYEYWWIDNKDECDNYLISNGYSIKLCEFDNTNKIAFL